MVSCRTAYLFLAGSMSGPCDLSSASRIIEFVYMTESRAPRKKLQKAARPWIGILLLYSFGRGSPSHKVNPDLRGEQIGSSP